MFFNILFIFCLVLMWWCFQGYFIYLRLLCPRIDFDVREGDSGCSFFSIIVPVCNEEGIIARKIENLKKIDYVNFEVFFVDASSDSTPEIILDKIKDMPNFKLITSRLKGRSSQVNLGLAASSGELILITDADSYFDSNALFVLNKLFLNPKIGVVGAWVEPGTGYDPDLVFWKFYNNTRYLESMGGFCSVVSGAGYSFRRAIVDVIPEDVWADDVYVPLAAHLKKFSCVCVHFMNACEHRGPLSLSGLFKNKTRKACDIMKEFFRFWKYCAKMDMRWRVIYFTKLAQMVFSPFLFIVLILLCSYRFYFIFLLLTLSVIFLFQRKVIGYHGRKKVGVIETIFVFVFTEVVLLIALAMYIFSSKRSFYTRQCINGSEVRD